MSPIPLRVVEPPDPFGSMGWWVAEPGAMWPCGLFSHRVDERVRCWVIRLPEPAHWWHTNGVSTDKGDHWQVSGEAPDITVHPSINILGHWHGWIKDGMITP